MSPDKLTLENLIEGVKILNREFKTSDKYKRVRKEHRNINELFCHTVIDLDTPSIPNLEALVNDPVYQLAYKLIRNCSYASGRKGESVSHLMDFIEPFIVKDNKIPSHFNNHLLPLLVLASGQYVSYTNYWSMKIKLDFGFRRIADITQSDLYLNYHKNSGVSV